MELENMTNQQYDSMLDAIIEIIELSESKEKAIEAVKKLKTAEQK